MSGFDMTPFALGFMTVSMVSVTALVIYCYSRILRDDRSLDAEAED